MATIADVGHGANLSDYLADLQDAADTAKRAPLPAWRINEHRFFNLQAWERMVAERPFPVHQDRTWNWSYLEMGIRTSHAAPSDSVMTRDVGARDLPWSWPYEWKRTVPSPAVHITFPDWA